MVYILEATGQIGKPRVEREGIPLVE